MVKERIPAIDVEARGRWDGRDVVRLAALHCAEIELVLTGGGEDLHIRCETLDDATWARGVLVLYAAPDALRITAAESRHNDLAAVWARLISQAGEVPEVARGLRNLGRPRSGVPAHHELFLAPLLAARRRLIPSDTVERRAVAFDAGAVTVRIKAVLLEIALDHYPTDAARRRGHEARLDEATENLLRVLAELNAQTAVVRECADGRRLAEWREWLRVLRCVFVESERSWQAVARVAPGGAKGL